jgi:hypothetical protein
MHPRPLKNGLHAEDFAYKNRLPRAIFATAHADYAVVTRLIVLLTKGHDALQAVPAFIPIHIPERMEIIAGRAHTCLIEADVGPGVRL